MMERRKTTVAQEDSMDRAKTIEITCLHCRSLNISGNGKRRIGRMWRERRIKYGLSMHITGKRGNCGVESEVRGMRKAGSENGPKVEKKDKTAGDKL
jgi:hypothetical protein